jgi:hypothetical protein
MEKRHGMNMDMSSGLVSAKDNTDACLWDALKSVAGTIAGALQPAASKAAGIGCGAIPIVGRFAAPLCESAARNLVGLVADQSKSSTNRHARAGQKGELGKFKTQMKGMKAVEGGELSEERPPLRRYRREDYQDVEEDLANEDEFVPRYRRTSRQGARGPKRASPRANGKKKKKTKGKQGKRSSKRRRD